MDENSKEFEIDFVPKTGDTFIAPNENFNSFTQNLSNSFGVNNKNDQKTNSEDDSQKTESTKRKADISVLKSDKFMDMFVNKYKTDGIILTLDENERQIYYCYYCHHYIIDIELIETHIDTSKHLNNVLNGISFDRGLDKEFVIDSISKKRPKNIDKLIYKELSRIPLPLKHYYFRNDIRLMDVMPPNAYFCKSCSESIPSLKSIDSHLLTEKHILSQQKPSLMEMIEKSEDSVLKIGLQFITEEKIADSSQVVYECELCNCFDCDYHKMFSHIKSRDHRINLLKRYDYESEQLSDEELENLIKEMHEKHGSGLMKTSESNKKLKTSGVSTPASLPPSDSPKIPTPEADSVERLSQILVTLIDKSKRKAFLREDRFLADFEVHKIIETNESDGREIYYCCYCDEYFNSLPSLERHIGDRTHINLQTNDRNSSKGLDLKLSMKKMTDPSLATHVKCLENIPILTKHFYFKRGIKHLSDNSFYCRLCQIKIQRFDGISSHFKSESHIAIEEIPTKFNDLLFQTNQPIIGLKYIKELINDKSKHILYECILCDYSQDYCQMLFHLTCFSHQFKVLKRLSPNNKVFKYVKENEASLKSSELLKAEISRIEEEMGCGFVTKCITNNSPKEPQNSSEIQPKKLKVVSKTLQKPEVCQQISEQRVRSSPLRRTQPTDKDPAVNQSPKNSETTKLTEEELLLSLQNSFSVRLQNEDEASLLVSIVESLKDSLIKYYDVIPLIPKQLQKFIVPKNATTDESTPQTSAQTTAETEDNHNVCEMEED